ncbi:hypothetical protein HPB50_025913 [Hyalomma asiaticum]|uniref:Uncharacterized protein n=1 Tax=Hyalomma asiaticum TaxID=266040 RepID=A0ACB7RQI5_HYAAI|nr:hypothetical protein HPB50_025913 [Hyalomma asiaticum]
MDTGISGHLPRCKSTDFKSFSASFPSRHAPGQISLTRHIALVIFRRASPPASLGVERARALPVCHEGDRRRHGNYPEEVEASEWLTQVNKSHEARTSKGTTAPRLPAPRTDDLPTDRSLTPRQRGRRLALNSVASKQPRLPSDAFKLIVRPRGGLLLSKITNFQLFEAVSTAANFSKASIRGKDLIQVNPKQNKFTYCTPAVQRAERVLPLKELVIEAHTYEISVYCARDESQRRGVIRGVDLRLYHQGIQEELQDPRNPPVVDFRRLGNTTAVLFTFKEPRVPMWIYLCNARQRCNLYKKFEVCYRCSELGHRADVCSSTVIRCRGCAIPDPPMEDFNAPHPSWGYHYDSPKGPSLWDQWHSLHLDLLTDPAHPTCRGVGVARDTTPDLTFVGPGVNATSCNALETFGTDHYVLEIVIQEPTRERLRSVRLTDSDRFRTQRQASETSQRITDISTWSATLLQHVADATTEVEVEKLVPGLQLDIGEGELSTITPGSRGTPQGSVLSPLLFNVALLGLPKLLADILNLHHTLYAADLALWVTRGSDGQIEEALQTAIDRVGSYLYGWPVLLCNQKRDCTYRPMVASPPLFSGSVNLPPKLLAFSSELPTSTQACANPTFFGWFGHLSAHASPTWLPTYLQLTLADLDRLDASLHKAYKTALGVPMSTSTYKLVALGVSNTVNELIEATLTSQYQRLSVTHAGLAVMHHIGLIPTRVATTYQDIPTAQRLSLRIPPLPKHMHPEHYAERRADRARQLQKRFASRADATYTDASRHPHRSTMGAVALASHRGWSTACSVIHSDDITVAEEVAIALAMTDPTTKVILIKTSPDVMPSCDASFRRVSFPTPGFIARYCSQSATLIHMAWTCPQHADASHTEDTWESLLRTTDPAQQRRVISRALEAAASQGVPADLL